MSESAAAPALRLRLRLTGRGIVALLLGAALLAGGLAWQYPGLVAFGAGLLLLVIAAVIAVRLPAPVRPRRVIAPLRVPRHGRCTGTLRIASGSRRLAIGLDADERIGDRRVPIVVPRLAAGATVAVDYAVPTARRGVVEVGPLRLRRVGTAGLAVAQGTVGGVVAVHVLPRVLPVRGLPAGVRRGHVGAEERVERGGTDLMALREYVPGDDLRRVHWATSARSGTLMVREDADPARPYLTVLLDDRAASYTGDQFEDAVEAAASLISAVLTAGHPVRLLSVAGRLDVDVPAAPAGMVAAGADEPLRALADVQPVADRSAPAPVPVRDLDVVVVATGAGAELAPLVAEAARAPLGVVLVVDERAAGVEARGNVLVLRGPRATELLHAWDAL